MTQQKRLYANNAQTELTVRLDVGETEIIFRAEDESEFPDITPGSDEFFTVTLDDKAGVREICKVTNRNFNILTVERAYEGTVELDWPVGTLMELRLTAEALDNFSDDMPFYGSYAEDPTEDPRGRLPQQGDLYFNTVAGEMRQFWGGGGTGWYKYRPSNADYGLDPPSEPNVPDGYMWVDPQTMRLYQLYNDGNSRQWVEVGLAGGVLDGSNELYYTAVEIDALFANPPFVLGQLEDVDMSLLADGAGLRFDETAGFWVASFDFASAAQGTLADTALQDAPSDGNTYGRKDGAWEVVAATGNYQPLPIFSDTAPTKTGLTPGQEWIDTTSMVTYVLYDDGDSVQWIQKTNLGSTQGPIYFSNFYGAKPNSNVLIMQIVIGEGLTLPVDALGSQGHVSVAPSDGDWVADIQKNGVSIGSLTFPNGLQAPTFSVASTQTFAAGDLLTIVAPGTSDASLTNVSITLALYRS